MTKTKFNFFLSMPYLIILSLSTLIFWYFSLENIGIPVFLGIIFILFVFKKNGIVIVPVIFNALFMISQTDWSLEMIPLYLYFVPVVLIIGFILHTIIYKVKLFRGDMLFGLSLMVIAMALSTINTEIFNVQYVFIFIVGLFYLFNYLFFVNSIDGDNTVFLIKLFVLLGMLVSAEVLIYYLRVDDVKTALADKEIDLGWGISNFIATYLIIFISATVYFIKKYKMHIIWILIVLFEMVTLLFTLSRGGILAFFVTAILLVIYMFHGYEHKWKLLLQLLIGFLILGAFVYWKFEYFVTIYDRMLQYKLDGNGRIEVWKNAIAKFKEYPLFGAGLFSRVIDNGTYFGLYHNTILHTLASFGIIGFIALFIQFIEVLKVFFFKLTQEKAILLIALAGANIHGMVDNIYYMPQFMIIFFIIIAVVENTNKFESMPTLNQ